MRHLTVLLLSIAFPVLADEVRLLNGDRITGEVREVTPERLVVRTDYAQDISIRLSDVHWVSIVDAQGAVHELGPLQLSKLELRTYRGTPGVEYSGRALLSAAFERGNAESDHVHARARLTARAKEYRYELSGRVERRSDSLAQASTAWLTDAAYDRFFTERQFAYVRGSLEHDQPKDIDRRATAGFGYGVQLVETAAASVALRGGLDYVDVERIVGANEDYPAAGWGIKARFLPRGPQLELFHEQEGFWNLEDTDAVLVRTQSGVRVPLVGRLKATAQLNVDWEAEPSPGRRSTDSTLLFGLDYDF